MNNLETNSNMNTETFLRPNGKRAKTAITLLWVIMALDFVSLVLNYFQYNLLNSPDITEEAANINDTMQLISSVLYISCYVVSIIVFLNWFRRAYHNLNQFDPYLSFSNKDVAISWFLPIINLFKPYQIMKEMYKKTKSLLEENDVTNINGLSITLLNAWWTLWVITSILSNISWRLSTKSETIDDIITTTSLDMVLHLISIPLAFLAIHVVRNYANIEAKLYQIPNKPHTSIDNWENHNE